MRFNRTSNAILSEIHDLIFTSFGNDLTQTINDNIDSVARTLQMVNDLDMEVLVDVMCWTCWYSSRNDDFDRHVVSAKDFIFSIIQRSNELFNGNVYECLMNGFDVESTDEDEVTDPDLIPDEVYGNVDPEEVSYLNQLLKL